MNKQKSINRQIKRGHIIVTPEIKTHSVITRWDTDPIMGGVNPVWEDKTEIIPIFHRRTKRGKLLRA